MNKVRILLFLESLKIQVSIDAEFWVVEMWGLEFYSPLGREAVVAVL